MSITFDMYGNVIPSKINKKQELTQSQKEIIREVRTKHKTDIVNEKRTYFCKVHNRFHKHLTGNKPSKIYLKCLQSGNVLKFKDDFSNSELFKIDLLKKWNQKNANYYK